MNGEVLEGQCWRRGQCTCYTAEDRIVFYFSLSLSSFVFLLESQKAHSTGTHACKIQSRTRTQVFQSTCLTCICIHPIQCLPPCLKYCTHPSVPHCCSLYGQEKVLVSYIIICLCSCVFVCVHIWRPYIGHGGPNKDPAWGNCTSISKRNISEHLKHLKYTRLFLISLLIFFQ